MKLWHLSIALMAVGVACSASSGKDAPSVEAVEATGTMQFALIGSDVHGNQYRLRNAEFQITRYYYYPYDQFAGAGGDASYDEVVSSEENPSATSIVRRVLPGYYEIYLRNSGWYFEKLTPDGSERITQAVLLSNRTVSTYVGNNQVSNVGFQFGVGGTLIDFRSGDLQITFGVETPWDGGAGGVTGGVGSGGVGFRE
jgi:hypothetical protein